MRNFYEMNSLLGEDWLRKQAIISKKTLCTQGIQEIDFDVEHLKISDPKVSDDALNTLLTGLKNASFPQLCKITFKVFNGSLSGETIRRILEALCDNQTVVEFSVQAYKFSEDSVEEIINVLIDLIAQNSTIESFNISLTKKYIGMMDEALKEKLINSLKSNPCITNFNINLYNGESYYALTHPYVTRNQEFSKFYKRYRQFLLNKDVFSFKLTIDFSIAFIKENYLITEDDFINTHSPKLIELYYVSALELCYRNFSSDLLKNLNIVNFLFTYIKINPKKDFFLVVSHILESLKETGSLVYLIEDLRTKALLVEVVQKMMKYAPSNLNFVELEIDVIFALLPDLDLEDRLRVHQRLIDLTYSLDSSSSLRKHLLMSALAIENEGYIPIQQPDAHLFVCAFEERSYLKLFFKLENSTSSFAFMEKLCLALSSYPSDEDDLKTLEKGLNTQLSKALTQKVLALKQALDLERVVKIVSPSTDKEACATGVLNILEKFCPSHQSDTLPEEDGVSYVCRCSPCRSLSSRLLSSI